jgi:hypothetical protein
LSATGEEYTGKVHTLFVNFKKACDLFRREVSYDILIELGTPMKMVRPIKMCLNETCIKSVQANI